VILGGQDGLVNTLGVLLGVAAASNDTKVVLAGGLAATLAESISMGAVAYTSKLAEKDFYKSEKAREYRHIEKAPRVETKEVRDLFAQKGFQGELLDRIVETVTAHPEIWVDIMLREEHKIYPVTRKDALLSSAFVFVAALLGSLVPLVPFFFLSPSLGIWISMAVCAIVLFVVGLYKSLALKVGNPFFKGLEMTLIGMASALVGWGIGVGFDRLWPD